MSQLEYMADILFPSKLTPWSRVVFEKLMVTQLVTRIPCLSSNPNVHYYVHNSPPSIPLSFSLSLLGD